MTEARMFTMQDRAIETLNKFALDQEFAEPEHCSEILRIIPMCEAPQ